MQNLSTQQHAANQPTNQKVKLLTRLLNKLEEELQQLGFPEQPSTAARQSKLPFCVDTMDLTAWLAWIFLPQMRQLIANNAPLSSACALSEQLEMQLSSAELAKLLPVTQALDAFLTHGKLPAAKLLKS